MADQQAALPGAATDAAALALAARLAQHGYRVSFPPGRDPAVFKVTGLPGSPDVEVTAEDNGQAACHYTGRSTAEVVQVIARLPETEAAVHRVEVVGGRVAEVTWTGTT